MELIDLIGESLPSRNRDFRLESATGATTALYAYAFT